MQGILRRAQRPEESPAQYSLCQRQLQFRFARECHLFGGVGRSYHDLAGAKDWDQHKLEHALRHTPGMVAIKLQPDQLDALVAYINSFKSQ